MEAIVRPHWIAVDWGTTHMRAYAMGAQGEVLARAKGPGMAALVAGACDGDFEIALLNAVKPWLGSEQVSVMLCGMVGSRQGWQEAGYLTVPQGLSSLGDRLCEVLTLDRRLRASIVPGLCQNVPFNVMRGEESQLAGYLAHQREQGDSRGGQIGLPGTHTKWVQLEGDVVTDFSTAMTGELFDLLSEQSILTHSMDGMAMDEAAFAQGVQQTFDDPARLTQALFSIRAEGLLTGEDGARARGSLSGLLIGAELAGADLTTREPVTLIGAPALCQAYQNALAVLGFASVVLDGEAMVLRGLSDLYAQQAQQQAPVF